MKHYAESISLENMKKNEFVTYLCLENKDTAKFTQLLRDGMPLTDFCLTLMVQFGYDKDIIKQTVRQAVNIDADVVNWLYSYLSFKDFLDIAADLEKVYFDISKFVTPEELAKNKMWSYLVKINRYDLIDSDYLEACMISSVRNFTYYSAGVVLLKRDFDKYADVVRQANLGAFLAVPNGYKYLVDHDEVRYILYCTRHLKALISVDNVLDYCCEKGFYQELYDYGFYKTLLKHGEFEIFVKNKSTYPDFLRQHPELVNWEDLWQTAEKKLSGDQQATKSLLLSIASECKSVPKCRDFVKNHSSILKRILLSLKVW